MPFTALLPLFLGRVPLLKNRVQKKVGTLIPASLLEDLVCIFSWTFSGVFCWFEALPSIKVNFPKRSGLFPTVTGGFGCR